MNYKSWFEQNKELLTRFYIVDKQLLNFDTECIVSDLMAKCKDVTQLKLKEKMTCQDIITSLSKKPFYYKAQQQLILFGDDCFNVSNEKMFDKVVIFKHATPSMYKYVDSIVSNNDVMSPDHNELLKKYNMLQEACAKLSSEYQMLDNKYMQINSSQWSAQHNISKLESRIYELEHICMDDEQTISRLRHDLHVNNIQNKRRCLDQST